MVAGLVGVCGVRCAVGVVLAVVPVGAASGGRVAFEAPSGPVHPTSTIAAPAQGAPFLNGQDSSTVISARPRRRFPTFIVTDSKVSSLHQRPAVTIDASNGTRRR